MALYRQRGKAEAHMGELMDVLNPALSARPRPWHVPDTFQPLWTEAGVYRNNETLFLLHLLAYEVLHAGGQSWNGQPARAGVSGVSGSVCCGSLHGC